MKNTRESVRLTLAINDSDQERPAFDVTGVDVAGVSLRVGARTPA